MKLSVFSGNVDLPAGIELGGYGRKRVTRDASSALEVNGLRFTCSESGEQVALVSLDALYAGDLVEHFRGDDSTYLFAASHTHTAPMLDSGKHGIGKVEPEALGAYVRTIAEAEWRTCRVDSVAVFSATVEVPIYRRRDSPDNYLNRLLTRYCGMFPNSREPIDRSLHLIVLMAGQEPVSALVWHSCHPTSRSDLEAVSADYIDSVRRAVRTRFGSALPCLFLQGCAGDIRPDSRSKRVGFVPDNVLNTRFLNPTSPAEQDRIDNLYFRAVLDATETERSPLNDMKLHRRPYVLTNGDSGEFMSLILNDIYRLDLLPFEVSHRYWMDLRNTAPRRFAISCCDNVKGYLPHPTQLRAGGYEVDGSRILVGAPERLTLAEGKWW